MSVSGRISIDAGLTVAATSQGTSYTGTPRLTYSKSFTTSDISYVVQKDSIALSTGGSVSYNLQDGSQTDPFGVPLVFNAVKHYTVTNSGPGLAVVGGGSNPVLVAGPALASGGCVCNRFLGC